ncbi:MAG: hypothetical protein ACPGVF_02235 [Flavobacteriaceae bacterium]
MEKQKGLKKVERQWKLIVIGVILLGIASVSPWIIAPHKVEPYWLGMPFALWTSILFTVFIILLTAVGGVVFSRKQNLKS